MSRPPSGPELLRRVIWLQYLLAAVANLSGAAVVFVFLNFLTGTGLSTGNDWASFGVILVYFGGAVLVSRQRVTRALLPAARWLEEDRPPTPTERDAFLRMPGALTLHVFGAWIGGAVLFGVLNATVFPNPAQRDIQIVITILLGGLTSCGMFFLLVERSMRTAFARALSGMAPDTRSAIGIRLRLLLSWALGSGVVLVGIATLPLTQTGPTHRNITGPVVFLAIVGVAAGAILVLLAAGSLADPIDDVSGAVRRVQDGDLSVRVAVNDAGEVGLLQSGFNAMVAGLEERLRLQDLFGRHVGLEVARHAMEQGAGLGGELRDVSALFVDVIGSTSLTERLSPNDVVKMFNKLFQAVVESVTAEGGWVNKFEGDAALCVFGAPGAQPDHAARALRAACSLRTRLDELERQDGVDAAIGVSSGMAVAGNIGAEDRYEYTVIGDPINEAARLTDLAKSRSERMLASGSTVAAAGEAGAGWDAAGVATLRGRSHPTELFVHTGAPKHRAALTS